MLNNSKHPNKQVNELTIDPKIKPNFLPNLPIILAATIVKIAVPKTDKAVGNVDKDFKAVICDPTIPLKKTVIIFDVKPQIWLAVNMLRFLFIKKYIYHQDKKSNLMQYRLKYKTTFKISLRLFFQELIPLDDISSLITNQYQ